MKSPIAKILSKFSKVFHSMMSGVAATIMNNLDDDSSVGAATAHAWAAYEVADQVGDAVRQSVKESYEEGVGSTIKLFPSHLDKAWDDSGMTLSEKLHGSDKEMRDAIVETIREQLKENRHAMQAARKLYDGYNSGHAVTRQQGIPKYLQQIVAFARHSDLTDENRNDLLRQVRRAKRQVERLGQGGAPNQALKTAYSELLDAVVNGSEKALSRSVHTAVEEKSRYVAERIARTEAARAWADGFAEKYMDDDSVVAFQWKLASRHPKFDICDLYAEANLYGLGKGIYPKNATPRLPVHPHCLCHLAPVYRSELKGKKAVDQLEEGGRAWLEEQSLYHRQQILGIQGAKAFANRDSWTKWARNYTGARLAGRPKDLPESLKPYLHDGKIKIEEISKRLPDESLPEFDERIHDYLESPYCTKAFTDRQKIHIKGTDLYNPDKSYYMNAELLNNIDIKELLLAGKIKLTKAGDWSKKVLVHHPGIKGVVVHRYGSDTVLTEYSLVHVSDKGVHMVPKEDES